MTYGAVHPGVRGREVGPKQLERQQAHEREHAGAGDLARSVGKDKNFAGRKEEAKKGRK